MASLAGAYRTRVPLPKRWVDRKNTPAQAQHHNRTRSLLEEREVSRPGETLARLLLSSRRTFQKKTINMYGLKKEMYGYYIHENE